MKMLKRITIWLVVLIALLLVMAYLLPRHYMVQRDVIINADGKTIYNMVCDFNNWDFWTPWSLQDDSTATDEIIGRCEAGAVYRWDGEDVGQGEMKILEIAEGALIKWDVGFEDNTYRMNMMMSFEKEGDGWLVTWTAEGDLGYNPLYRYYGLMIDSEVGADLERGLSNLKAFCELLPDYPGIEIVDLTSGNAVAVRDSLAMGDMQVFMEVYFPRLYMYALRNEATITGPPYSIYYSWDPEGKSFMEIGIPVADELPGEEEIIPSETPGGKAVTGAYYGPYEGMNTIYNALEKYMQVLKLEPRGMAWEVYITDPSQEPDTSKWETHVYFPIK